MLTIIHPCLQLTEPSARSLLKLKETLNNKVQIIICTPDEINAKKTIGDKGRIIIDQKNGVYNAINQAIEEIPSGWIQIIGDTDTTLITPYILECIYKSSAEIILGNWLEGRSKDSLSLRKAVPPTPYSLGRFNCFNHQACLIRKELHTRIGMYNTNYQVCADFEFITRAVARRISIEIINIPLATFIYGGISSKDQIANELERALAIRHNLTRIPWLAFIKKIILHYLKNALSKLIN